MNQAEIKVYSIKLVNSWTNKSKMKTVKAATVWEAERAARSNYMMANGWHCVEINEVI